MILLLPWIDVSLWNRVTLQCTSRTGLLQVKHYFGVNSEPYRIENTEIDPVPDVLLGS
jgi:hypothetical protein